MDIGFRVLGPLSATGPAGAELALGGRMQRAVLGRLIVARGRTVPVDLLVEDLWPVPPRDPVGTVRTFVAALRRVLEPDRPPRAPARLLVTEGAGYGLRTRWDQVDAERVERAVAGSAALPPDRRREALERALAAWRGPAYAEFADEAWARTERTRLTELRLRAVELLAAARLELGAAADAVADLDAHVAEQPWREEGWRLVARVVPRSPVAAVGVAGLAGAVLPGCECSSVPLARRLAARGVPTPAALSFLLAAPAVNPVVVMATLVAFPGRPEMALARWLAALATAMGVGLLWTRLGRPLPLPPRTEGRPVRVLLHTVVDDTTSSVGYLAVGAAAGATLTVLVPRHWIDALAGYGLVSVLAMAVLAVLLAVCSEADAFLAAALRSFSPTAQLAFMVVGPVVDLKLIALQAGTFGMAVTRRLAPLAFAAAVVSATVLGAVLL